MSTVAEYLERLDAQIPLSKAGGWDPIGLQVGDGEASVASVAVCHEVTPAVTAAMEQDPVDLLISYHPLLFRAAASFVAGSSASGRAFRLGRSGVAVAVVHTAFDVAPGGVADALADVAGIDDARGFGPNWGGASAKIVTFVPAADVDSVADAMTGAGGGQIGRYAGCSYRSPGTGVFTPLDGATPVAGSVGIAATEDEIRLEMVVPAAGVDRVVAALVAAHPYEEPAYDVYETRSNAGFIGRHGAVAPMPLGQLAARIAAGTGASPRIAGADDRTIQRVAVVPGSGGSFIAPASVVADVLVTGDVSHHQARDGMARGLAVMDIGHVPSERPGLDRLYAAVSRLGTPTRSLLDLDPDPWS